MNGRTLHSASLVGFLLAAEIAILILYLNPEATLRGDGAGLFLSIVLPYTVAATVALLAIALLAGATGLVPEARPPLAGLPWFATFSVLAHGAGAALLWSNLVHYRYSIPVASLRALAGSASTVTGAGLVIFAVAVDAAIFPRRGRGISAALAVLASAAAVVVPLALRPAPAPAPARVHLQTEPIVKPARRIVLLGVDGLGPRDVLDATAAGRLPAFGRLLRRGAYGPLATLEPTEGPPIWTTILTGRLPRDHGVKSFAAYRLRGSSSRFDLLPQGAFVGLLERAGLVSTSAVSSESRKRRTLWNALNAFGVSAGVVRIWGTYPVEPVPGFMLAPSFDMAGDDPARLAASVHPIALLPEIQARRVDPSQVEPARVSEFMDAAGGGEEADARRADLVNRALAPDLTYQRAGAVMRAALDPPFFATSVHGLDITGHAFMRYARPDAFGNVTPEQVRRYGRVIERYQDMVSDWVGEASQRLGPGEILVVVSAYGMHPVSPARRLLNLLTGGDQSGTHADAPDGFFMIAGDGIKEGVAVPKASVLDLAPTLLYVMGLPVARDMEGRALTEIVDDEFARDYPVTFVPSYESLAVTTAPRPGAPDLPPLPGEEP